MTEVYPTAKISERTLIEGDESSFIGDYCLVSVPLLRMGRGSHINAGARVVGRGSVSIGDYSVVSYDVLIITSTDTPEASKMSDYAPEEQRNVRTSDITIGMDCFIGAQAVLMPGAVIGDGSVVYSGCYVDQEVPPNSKVMPKYRGNKIVPRRS